MSWEALTALSTAFTGLVILFTVLVGWHQMRVAAEQSLQAHRATQLDGMMRIFDQFDAAAFIDARRYIMTELAAAMERPDFDELLGQPQTPWMPALRTLERMGVYIKMGLLDAEPFYYHVGFPIMMLTRRLQPLIERQRVLMDNPYLWKDTERLGRDLRKWAAEFMRGDPRLRPSTGHPYTVEDFEAEKSTK